MMSHMKLVHFSGLNDSADFVVLILTYYSSSLLLALDHSLELALQAVICASFVFLCVVFFRVKLSSTWSRLTLVTRRIMGYAIGILVSTIVMCAIVQATLGGGDFIVVMLFSSAMAFFVLGTILPLVHKQSSS